MKRSKKTKIKKSSSRLPIVLSYCSAKASQVKDAALSLVSRKFIELATLGVCVYILLSVNALHIKLNIFYQEVGQAFQEVGMGLTIMFMTLGEALQELLQRGQSA